MSLKSRGDSLLNEISAGLEKPRGLPPSRGPGTAVGMIVSQASSGLRSQLDEAVAERDEALRKLEELMLQHGSNLLEVDPARVAPSPFAIRIKQAFSDAAFESLCDDIKRIGGNLAPVLIRAYTGTEKGTYDYELIAGHRRRAACERLGMPVIAIIKEVDDREAVRLMASENDNREQESRYELGLHYQHLLDTGRATSVSDLSHLVAKPRSSVQRCLKAASIAPELVELFSDPREIRLEWLDPLIDAWKNRRDVMPERMERVRSSSRSLSSLATFKLLTQESTAVKVKPETIRINDQAVVKITTTPTGRVGLTFMEGAPKDVIERVMRTVRDWQKELASGESGEADE